MPPEEEEDLLPVFFSEMEWGRFRQKPIRCDPLSSQHGSYKTLPGVARAVCRDVGCENIAKLIVKNNNLVSEP